jgi:hypothetical protein
MTLGLSFRIITILILILITYKNAISSSSYALPHSTLNTRACLSNPIQACTGPYGSRSLSLPERLDNRHMKVVRLSALRIGRLYPREDMHDTHFRRRLSRPQGYIAVGRIKSMKNPQNPIGNRTRYIELFKLISNKNG